jgi:Flp pilus assembly protein TadD
LFVTAAGELLDRARALHASGQLTAAEGLYRQLLDSGALAPMVLPLLTAVYQATSRPEEALACCRRLVAIEPENARAHYNLAVVLLARNQVDEAIASFRRATALAPSLAEAFNNLGVALVSQNRWDEAAAAYRKALRLRPDYVEALYNLARPLLHLDEVEEAVACCRHALALRPDHADAHYRLGLALSEENLLDEAVASYERALALRPNDAEAHLGLALALLRLGRYDEAWPHYEWRTQRGRDQKTERPGPSWSGSDLRGQTILLWSEQGVGDTLQLVRYVSLVRRQAGRVIVRCPRALTSLVGRVEGVDEAVSDVDPLPSFDVQASLASLPAIFRTSLETIPARVPYIHCQAEAIEFARSRIATARGFKLGIAWQGSLANPRDRARSIPLAHFSGLAETPGIELFSFQYGPGREQLEEFRSQWPIVDLGDDLSDFERTAALMGEMDLIVTCDSAPAHLAGARGLRVWVALPFSADWRWLLDRRDSPWYPSMRLFRQPERGDWVGVFREIQAAVAKLAAENDFG